MVSIHCFKGREKNILHSPGKALYLLTKRLKEHDVRAEYLFDDFMIHSGPFDSALLRDLSIWEYAGLVKNMSYPFETQPKRRVINTHGVKLTDDGKDYAIRYARQTIARELKSQKLMRELEDFISQSMDEDEAELIRQVNAEWVKEKEDRPKIVEKLFAPTE